MTQNAQKLSSPKGIMCHSASWILQNKLIFAVSFIGINLACLKKLVQNLIIQFL